MSPYHVFVWLDDEYRFVRSFPTMAEAKKLQDDFLLRWFDVQIICW